MTETKSGERYAREAKKELDNLKNRIETMRARHDEQGKDSEFRTKTSEDIDWEKIYRDLQARAHEVGTYIEELTEELRKVELKDIGGRLSDLRRAGEQQFDEWREIGEQRWSDIQARAESGFWDLRAHIQRISDGFRPSLHSGSAEHVRYYLQKARDGRWALIQSGASAPTMFFENKSEGLKASRRYVRQRRPSELVVRRADGTFEHIHTYPA